MPELSKPELESDNIFPIALRLLTKEVFSLAIGHHKFWVKRRLIEANNTLRSCWFENCGISF